MITFILVVVLIIFALIACFGLMALIEEGEPMGFPAIIIGGVLALGTMGAVGDYRDLQAQAATAVEMQEQRDSVLNKYDAQTLKYATVAKNYREVQLAYGETSEELSRAYGKIEGLKGNLEKAQSDLVGVKAANEFCATDLQMTVVENGELKDALRVTEGQLNTVRNLIRGN